MEQKVGQHCRHEVGFLGAVSLVCGRIFSLLFAYDVVLLLKVEEFKYLGVPHMRMGEGREIDTWMDAAAAATIHCNSVVMKTADKKGT